MEAPPEDQLESLKTLDSDMSDSTITSSLPISPKKPIQLGVVQSSTGSRPSPGNLSLIKKSRWDQAPGSGENEEEPKETNIEPNQSEECNVKNLIQKFEDISGSSKSDSEKSNESANSKPGRVKLVRTNFTKPEKTIVKLIDNEKVDETSKIEEVDVKSVIQPSEVLVKEVISVSSSKALQIISSNYDSHSDESSQEADNMPSNLTQDKPSLDSAYASLERLSEGNDSEEKETTEEKLKSSHSLKSESAGGSNIENKNSGVTSDCETKELKKDGYIEEKNSEVISFDTVDIEMNPDDSQLKYQSCKIDEVASKESTTLETNATITEQQEKENGSFHEKGNPATLSCTQEISETPNIFNPSISSGSKTEGEQNIVKTIELESVEASDNTKIDNNKQLTVTEINTVQEQLGAIELESGDAPGDSLMNKKIDENKKSTVTEINNVQAQLEAIELESDSNFENKCVITNSDALEENPTKIGGSLEDIIEETDQINSGPLSEEKENDIKIDDNLEKSSNEVVPSETANEDDDFVIVTHADIEGYKLNNVSVSETECIAIAETGNLSDIETNTTVNACDNNVEDNLTAEISVMKNAVTEGIVEDFENSNISQEADQLKQHSDLETNITANACSNNPEDKFTAEISVMKNTVIEGNVEDVENSEVAQEAKQLDLQSDIETNVTVNACGDNVEDTAGADISEVKTTITESNLEEEDGKNSKVAQEAEQRAGYSDNKTTDKTKHEKKTVSEIIKILDTEDDNRLTLEKEKHKESINESKPTCVETSSENTSQTYNDGVDAKMEQIFSENLETVSEEPCSLKSNVEEDLISVTDMLKEENDVLEEPVCSNVSSEQEESENKLETNDSLLKILESEGSPEVFVDTKDNNGSRVNVEAKKSDKGVDKCNIEETEFTKSDDFNENKDSGALIVAPEQNNTKPEESGLIKGDKDIALTEKVTLEMLNIEEVVSNEACTKEVLVLQREITNPFQNTVNKDTTDVVDSKSGIALEIEDLKHESGSAHCHEAIAEGIGNSQIQNLSTESTSPSVGKQSSESEGLSENKVEKGISRNNEKNTNIEAKIEGDEKNELKNELISSKTAKESDMLNEVEDVQLLNVIDEGNSQAVEAKFIVDETTVVEDESEDPQTDMEFSGGDNVVKEGKESLISLVDSKITEMSDSSEKQESEVGLLTVEEISKLHTETDVINKSDEFNRGECMSNTMPAETIQVTSISEVPENSIPLRNLPNEIESEKLNELMTGSLISESLKVQVENDLSNENAAGKVVAADEIRDNSEKSLNLMIPQTADVEKGSNILISEFKNTKGRDSNNTYDMDIDSPGCSVQKETENKTKEILGVEDATVSDSHCYSVDVKQTTGKKEGSIEVSQQETIERSIDMLFEVPNSDQQLKSSTMASASPSKDNMLEVSSEARKLFSEEIEREMLKLSPEHEAEGNEETTDLPETNRLSPSIKKFDDKTFDTSESNVNILSDLCESSKDSTINNDENNVKLPLELEGEKETSPSDDSDIATIQEIDSFLEGSNMQGSKGFPDSNSKYENLPIEIDDESNKQITSKEEELENFTSCRPINEKTSAEDVLLGVEGDLDLDNSLTYDNKKLGLSPSSQPSISEDNYDLPGESYDKESLEKEREATGLISGVLEDVEKNSSQCDSELPVSKCNKSEAKELFVIGATTVSKEVLREEICDVAQVHQEDSLKENNQSGAKANLESSQSKTQTMDFTSGNEIKINEDKIEEEFTIREESKVEESCLLHETDVETLSISTKNDSETLPNSSISICDKKEEVYAENPTKIDIEPSSSDSNMHDQSIASKEVTLSNDYVGKSRDGDVEEPKGNLVFDDVCDVPAYISKHEEEVKGSTQEKGNEKRELELKLGNKEVSNKPDATPNEIEPQKSKFKDVDVDFENLIPHTTVSSKVNEDLKSIVSKADKSEIREGSHENVNVFKEDKREQSILVNPNESVGIKAIPISEDKKESPLEKSECPSSEKSLGIHSDKEGKVPLAGIPNNESNNKTSKRPCPSIEVNDDVSIDQDNLDTKQKNIKKTKTSDVESDVEEPSKPPNTGKNVPGIKDSSVPPSKVPLNQTPIKTQPLKVKTKNVSHEEKKTIPLDDASLDQANSATPVKSESSEEESISLDLSPNQSSGATSTKYSEKIISPKIASSVVKKSSPQKNTLNKIPGESKAIEGDTKNTSSEEKKTITLPASSLDQASSVISGESESLKEYPPTKTDSSLEEKSTSIADSLNQVSKPLIAVTESKPGKDSISADINLEAEVNQARAQTSSVNSEPSIKLISTDLSDDKKLMHNIDSLNQAPKSVPTPFTVLAESSKENSTTKSGLGVEVESVTAVDSSNQAPVEAISPSEQAGKPSKSAIVKEIPAPVRVSARQKQRQAAAAAALAAKEKAESVKSPGQSAPKKIAQEKQGDKRGKKSLSPTKELHIKTSGKSLESGKQSPLDTQKSPKSIEAKVNLQVSPKKVAKEVGQDKLEPITLKLSKEENPVIVRSSSLSPKKNVSPHSPQGKTLGYTLKIGKDSTTIIPKESTSSPTRREASPGTSSAKADLSDKVSYLIKDTGLTITPVAPAETQEQKLNKITLKLSKAGGHPEIKQENKSETWKAIRKLGEIDIVPVDSKAPTEIKRKDKIDEGSPEKKLKLGDVTVEPSTSSGVSKLQGLLTQAPLNQSDSSEDGKFIGFGSPTEKLSPAQQQASYDIGMIRHDDSPQPPRKRGRPRKITSPDEIVHSVSVPHSLPPGLTAKDILAASLQHQSLQQHLHSSYQPPQSFQAPEEVDSSQPMVPLFDLFEVMDPSPPTIFPDQVQPSTDIIMRSARGRPIGRSRRPRGSGLVRGHERGGPRGRPRGSRGIKRILEEMEAMSFPDPDQPITLENIDAEMGPRIPEHAASELTMALLRKSIEGKKEILEKKARRSDGSEEGNSDLEAKVREMKEKIEEAYQAQLKSPGKEAKKRTPEKPEMKELTKKSPPGLIPLQKLDENARRKSADGKELVKRKLSEDKTEDGPYQLLKRRSTDENPECSTEESAKEVSQMEIDQTVPASEDPGNQEEIKTEPEPPPKPVKPRPKSKAEIKRIKREKDRLRREAKKLAALEALKAPPPNPCEEDTRMSASDPNGEGIDGEGGGIKKNRMEVGDPEGKEFTVEQIAEYQWPLQGGELYMIQEQISTWLGVKSFQRKYPDLKRRRVEMEERTYLCDSGLVAESMCDLGLTAVSSSEVLDIMFQDFPEQYEELRKHMREKQARELINKQKERKKFEQTLSKSDLKEHAIQSLVSWNANLNKSRNESRKCHLDLQTWTIQYPRNKAAKMTRPTGKLGSYPVALIPGQYADYYKRYTPQELRYFPVNTVLYGPLQPNEMHSTAGGSDGSQSESEDTSSSDGSSDSSSEGEGDGTEEEDKERERERECKTCGSKKANEAMLQCSQCSHNNTTVTVWA